MKQKKASKFLFILPILAFFLLPSSARANQHTITIQNSGTSGVTFDIPDCTSIVNTGYYNYSIVRSEGPSSSPTYGPTSITSAGGGTFCSNNLPNNPEASAVYPTNNTDYYFYVIYQQFSTSTWTYSGEYTIGTKTANFTWTGQTATGTGNPLTCNGTQTQICGFNPEEGSTTPSGTPINFALLAYVNANDIGYFSGIRLTLHNIDQNVLLISAFSPADIWLIDTNLSSAGLYGFSTSTFLADGNYRLEACMERSYFAGYVMNPFADVIAGTPDCQSHQFIVGTSTFIGNVSQNGFNILNTLTNGTTTATTTAEAQNCYFWYPTKFNIFKCGAFLIVPDAYYLNRSLLAFKEGVLIRIPWGYVTRTYNIMAASTTQALPTFTTSFQTGTNGHIATNTLTFDPGDMLAGAGTLLNNVRDPFSGKNTREVFEPFVQLTIALGVFFTILWDLMHMGGGESGPAEPKRRVT